jgi:hypothetical protein
MRAARAVGPVIVPTVKMWVLAVLSLFTFHVTGDGSSRTILPLGVAFATWCWIATAHPLGEIRRRGLDGATAIWAARIVAVVLAVLSVSAALA